MNTKVRIVRCPRCQLFLLEPAELPLYKCGGCDTILQAKTKKNDTKAIEPCNLGTTPVSEDNHNSSLNQLPTPPSTEESASVKSGEGDQIEFNDHKSNQFDGVENSGEIPISIELSCHENEDSSPDVHAHLEPDDNSRHLDKYNNTNHIVFKNSNDSDEGQSSSSTDEIHLSKSPSVQNNRNEENRLGNYGRKCLKEVCSSSSEHTFNEIEELSQAAGSGMAEDSKSCFIFRSSSPDNRLESRLTDSDVICEDLASGSPKQMKQEQNDTILPSFERLSSADTMEYVPCVNSSFQHGVERPEMYEPQKGKSYVPFINSGFQHGVERPEICEPQKGKSYFANDSRGKEMDDKIPKQHLHYYPSSSQAGPSVHRHKESLEQRLLRRVYRSEYKPKYHESDKVELLRRVYELQNLLNKTHISEQRCLSSYQHDYLARERHISDGTKYSCCRRQVSCSCFHRSTRDLHFSAQLPPCGNYHPYQSGLSSRPPQLRGGSGSSKFSSWSCDINMSDDQKRKQHLRPIAGGSPIIACYRCFQVLKVSSEFLLFKRRCHKLRCSACSEVLKFSLQNRIHIVRYIPDDIAPPHNEVDGYADATKKKKSVIEISQNNNENPQKTYDHAGRSMELSRMEKTSPETEEITVGRSSALHRLMGYSSPSKVLNG